MIYTLPAYIEAGKSVILRCPHLNIEREASIKYINKNYIGFILKENYEGTRGITLSRTDYEKSWFCRKI